MAFDPAYSGAIDGSERALSELVRKDRTPSAADVAHLVALYDQGIAYADFWIGKLVDGLVQRGLLEHAVVVVTADHGEELLDHGAVQHGAHLHDEVMRVPLIMKIPAARPRVVTQLVGLIDVMPTLLDVLRIGRDLPVQGRSLMPLVLGESLAPRPLFAEAPSWGAQRAMRTERWKYIVTPGTGMLFDLTADPGETVNLCVNDPGACVPCAREMARWEAENLAMAARLGLPPAPPARINEPLRRRLRALGYEEP